MIGRLPGQPQSLVVTHDHAPPPRFTTIDGSGLPARDLCEVCGISVLRDRARDYGPRRCAKHKLETSDIRRAG